MIRRWLGRVLCRLGRHLYDRSPLHGPSKRHCLRDGCEGWDYFGATL